MNHVSIKPQTGCLAPKEFGIVFSIVEVDSFRKLKGYIGCIRLTLNLQLTTWIHFGDPAPDAACTV